MKNIVSSKLVLKYLVAATLWLGFTPALATTAFSMQSVDQLTKHADLVVHGKVESIESYMDNNQIFTHIQVSVAESLKGKSTNNTVTLRMYGGTVDGKRTRVIGAPCLSSGEEVVLFLKSDRRGSYGVLNLAEGKFGVRTEKNGTKSVVRNLDGIRYLQKSSSMVPQSLEEIKDAVYKSR